jgi:glucoamylase
MDVVRRLYEAAPAASADRARDRRLLLAYVAFSRSNQLTPNRSGGADDLGLGEPKFNLDGSAFDEPWGRPQNDGPALRASTLIRWAWDLLGEGGAPAALASTRAVIQSDLEYVAHHWRDPSYDLWEEVQGSHFYTEMVQRRALLEGADLAERLGDGGAAVFYRAQARALESEIARHWDAARGYVLATLDRSAGHDEKTSGLDVAVILGALHGAVHAAGANEDPFFGVLDDRVLATATRLETAFRATYPINASTRDTAGWALGTAIGRYPEDRYSGGETSLGNPWFLATDAYAELCYRQARLLSEQGSISVTAPGAAYFNALGSPVRPGERIVAGQDARFDALVRALQDAGDAYLRRVRRHTGPGGALSEQFDRNTGYMTSANQLTWSHASLLTAAWARDSKN